MDGGLVGRAGVKQNVFENLALLAARGFAIRTPVEMMHRVLARPELQKANWKPDNRVQAVEELYLQKRRRHIVVGW